MVWRVQGLGIEGLALRCRECGLGRISAIGLLLKFAGLRALGCRCYPLGPEGS